MLRISETIYSQVRRVWWRLVDRAASRWIDPYIEQEDA